MSDEGTTTSNAPADNSPNAETAEVDWQAKAAETAAELEKYKALSRKNEDRAKSNAAAAKELEKLRQASMSETEKAVAEAEKRASEAASAKAVARVVRAEFRAAAAGILDKDTLNAYLEDVDLSRFADEDGEPDFKAIEARIQRLSGGSERRSFDGGARKTAKTMSPSEAMNHYMRTSQMLG